MCGRGAFCLENCILHVVDIFTKKNTDNLSLAVRVLEWKLYQTTLEKMFSKV